MSECHRKDPCLSPHAITIYFRDKICINGHSDMQMPSFKGAQQPNISLNAFLIFMSYGTEDNSTTSSSILLSLQLFHFSY